MCYSPTIIDACIHNQLSFLCFSWAVWFEVHLQKHHHRHLLTEYTCFIFLSFLPCCTLLTTSHFLSGRIRGSSSSTSPACFADSHKATNFPLAFFHQRVDFSERRKRREGKKTHNPFSTVGKRLPLTMIFFFEKCTNPLTVKLVITPFIVHGEKNKEPFHFLSAFFLRYAIVQSRARVCKLS